MRLMLIVAALSALSLKAESEVSDLTVVHDPISKLTTVTYRLGGDDAIVTLAAKTNGVAVADSALVHVAGDANRLVRADGTEKTLWWRARTDLPETDVGALSVSLKLWSPAHPPKYMVVDLDLFTVGYYVDAAVLPQGGLTNDLYRTCKLACVLVPAAGNTFVQGSPTTEADRVAGAGREAQRLVSFTNDFYMGVFPVTQDQHRRIYGSVSGSQKTSNPMAPVAQVKYNDLRGATTSNPKIDWPNTGYKVLPASILGKWQSKTGIDFDLPTSAQWEYACRAGCGDTWYWGGNHTTAGDDYAQIRDYAWCGDNCKAPQRVGEKGANAFGLYDMIGNVWEGCLDWGNAITLPSAGTALVEPTGSTTGTTRLWRGGTYSQGAQSLRSAKINPRAPDGTSDGDGYRLVCPPALKR